MAALASVEELAARLPFVMDADEVREAEGALEDLSDDARHYGKASWLDPAKVPAEVKNLITRAASRHMKNYDGFTGSRAGDEDVNWVNRGEDAGSAYFTEREIKKLKALGGNQHSGFYSTSVAAWGSYDRNPQHVLYPRDEDGFRMPIPSEDDL
jgi:hypothetical protein